jgi:hypothetical protein
LAWWALALSAANSGIVGAGCAQVQYGIALASVLCDMVSHPNPL